MPRATPADLRLYYLQRPVPTVSGLGALQSYFPSLEVLFPSLVEATEGSPTLAAKELAVSVDPSSGTAVVEDILTHAQRPATIWIRRAHLVDPVDAMSGELVLPTDGGLPASRGPWQRALRKLNDPYNEAYTDAIAACMASRLVETGRSPHFVRFYGTMNGRVPEYTYNLTEDMPDVEGEAWFRSGLLSGAFRVVARDPWNPGVSAELTVPWEDIRRKLDAAAEDESLSGGSSSNSESATEEEEDSASHHGSTPSASSSIGELEEVEPEVSGSAEIRRPRLRLERHSPADSDDGSGSYTEDDDVEYTAVLPNFPVQLTVLERCDGTMDDLMEDEIDEDATEDMRETKEQRWTAWMFQVIAGLTAAQSAYDLVHNDLHTNNVMWSGTGETHLYYHITGAQGGDRYYRVPTYGRIMKIIDFGRATFRPPAAGANGRMWLPDGYAPGADAAGQYNCGPYFTQGQPKVQPNKSFDLCRLAVAMLETLWPEAPVATEPRRVLTRESGRVQPETVSPLWNLLWLWLTDRHGRNVLRSPDGTERYPNFDLYCAIARDSQNAIPAQQLTLPLFDAAFRCRRKDIPADASIFKLHVSHR